MTERPAHAMQFARLIRAPREELFRAFLEPEALRAWWAPKGWRTPHVEIDARPGGRYRFGMQPQEGGGMMFVHGEYRVVEPPARLVFTYVWEAGGEAVRWEEFALTGVPTVVTLEFRERGGSTELFIRHEGFPTAGGCAEHERGWDSNWDCLEDYVLRGIVKNGKGKENA